MRTGRLQLAHINVHVRNRDPAFLLGDSAFHVALRIGAHVFLDQHDVLDQHLASFGKHPQHAAFFALIAAGDHFHRIVAADINSLV